MSSLRFRYQTLDFGDVDIHLRTLRDRQQFDDPGGVAEELGISSASWPIFGVVWASGEALAHLMLDYDVVGRRILEVGCGIGLASLMLNQRLADITATDHHPAAGKFLQQNVSLNNGREIPFVRTGWDDDVSDLGKFDLIIGSDLLYERDHAELLAGFIDQHAKPKCKVIIIDPCRGHSAKFSKKMVSLGYSHSQRKSENIDPLRQPFRGNILSYSRLELAH